MGDKTSPSNVGVVVSVRAASSIYGSIDICPPSTHCCTQRGKDCHRGFGSTRRALRAWNSSNPTQGLARGVAVEDTGGPLKAPVGKAILSRMFDVFGNAIDREPAPTDVQWRTVHRAPPPLARRSTKSEIFETGIKVIDVLVPLERGGKAGLFGGAG